MATSLKLTVDREAFREALAFVAGVVPSRPINPVLACVKLAANGGAIRSSCTSLDIYAEAVTPNVAIEGEGVCCVSAEKLLAIVGAMPDEFVTLTQDDTALTVRGAADIAKVYTVEPERFPPPPTVEGDAISMPEFATAVASVSLAAKKSDSAQFVQECVLLYDSGSMAAIDGRRMHWFRPAEASKRSAKVPVSVMKLAAKMSDEIAVVFTEDHIRFAAGDRTLTSSLMEGRFFDCAEIVPPTVDSVFDIDSDKLLGLVELASVLTSDYAKGVRLEVTPTAVKVTSRDPSNGEASGELPIKLDGKPMTIGLNAKYLADAIRACGSTVRFGLNAPNRPAKLEGDGTVAVVMSVSLN